MYADYYVTIYQPTHWLYIKYAGSVESATLNP